MKCNQSLPGFELVSPCPFPTTITITPQAPPNCNILTPSSLFFSSTSFSFCWAAQSGVLRAHSHLLGAGSLYSILSLTNWLQLTELPVAPVYIIVWHPPASCGRHICTQFNPSIVKVIPWYLRPDVPVIYTGAFLIWLLGRGSICYYKTQQNSKCRLCDDRDETINHIISEYSKLAQKEYKTRHDWAGMVIHCELCKKLRFDHTTKWNTHKPESALENETHKLLWDFGDTNRSPNLGQKTRPCDSQ